jgi:DNA helicase IV
MQPSTPLAQSSQRCNGAPCRDSSDSALVPGSVGGGVGAFASEASGLTTDEVREAAKRLVSTWVPAARDWYLHSLLPALDVDLSLALDHERVAIDDIRRFEPGADLASLAAEAMPPLPIDGATRFRFEKLVERFSALIARSERECAVDLYRDFPGAESVGSLEELLRIAKTRGSVEGLASRGRQRRLEALRSEARQAVSKGDIATLERMAETGGLAEEAAELEVGSIAREIVRRAFPHGDPEKEAFLSSCRGAVLLKARAGSGKTTAIAIKVNMLCSRFRIDPARLIVLAFNKKAADEIGRRIREFGVAGFANARTFHSLAWQVVRPNERPLFDPSGDERGEQTAFVGDVLRSIWTAEIERQVYSCFRREIDELKQLGEGLSDRDYHILVRNLSQVSLKGDDVKSAAEKWIADFLFEHDIPYEYERPYFWRRRIYRPDFTIFAAGKETILEHWGIDPAATGGEVPRGWTRSWDEYREEIEWKRQYWAQDRRGRKLIETSSRDAVHGREAFEAVLKVRLQNTGIRCDRLDDAEIAWRVVRKGRPRLLRMLVQFISKAKKAGMSPSDVSGAIAKSPAKDPRTGVFEAIASHVYSQYQVECRRQQKIDFDDLVTRCVDRLRETGGRCSLSLSGSEVLVRDIDWLLIDEYQDFTEAFRRVTGALWSVNPDLRITCVGDDWQAINGFAGSHLKFFRSFGQIFHGGKVMPLLTNHRSASGIVAYGNKIMAGKGEPARPAPGRVGGEVAVEYIEDVWIELRQTDEHAEARDGDLRFLSAASGLRGDAKLIYARLQKRCYQDITGNLGASFLLLARTNYLHGVELKEFGPRLKRCFGQHELKGLGEFEDAIRVMTVHRSKGLEADFVVLDAVARRYPLLHPNEPLYRLFGSGYGSVLEEERRLFYVACSRARKGLLLLTEKESRSDFI